MRTNEMDRRLLSVLITAGVFALDRLTKVLIQSRFSPFDTLPVIPGLFNIVHSENPGIAFGMFAEARNYWFRGALLIGFSVVVLIVVSAILLRPASASLSSVLRTALALVLGGAAGNLYDRVVHGTVTDFVELHAGPYYFPAFNVADSAITVGACLLLLDMWFSRERKNQPVNVAH